MLQIKIKTWDKGRSWTNWGGRYKKQFIHRVREHTSMSNTEIKRLAKKVFDEESSLIVLDKISKASEAFGVCHLLESMSAMIEVI